MHRRGLAAAWLLLSCAHATRSPPPDPSAETLAIVDEYLARYFERYPESATVAGWPGADHAAATDPSLAAIRRWQSVEDSFLARLRAIDRGSLAPAARASRDIVVHTLEARRARRVCRDELWAVSSIAGWHSRTLLRAAEAQPVGTPDLRAKAIARIEAEAATVDARIATLREGLRTGYLPTRENVERVLGELDGLVAASPAESPFLRPALRDGDGAFRAGMERSIGAALKSALRRYRSFLASEVLPRARAAPGVSALPGGEGCYRAAVLEATTLDVSASTIHETGLAELARIRREMEAIGGRSFGTRNVGTVLERLRSDPAFSVRSREEVLAIVEAALERAQRAAPRYFRALPRSEVVVRPYPEFQRSSSPADSYLRSSPDGSRPGTYFVNAFVPPPRGRAAIESITFHETVPGHHLQSALALERGEVPAGRYLWNSGFGEGWALYAEGLADEMGLLSDDVDRMGRLSSEALRAARLVVDSGMHELGWSRQQAIDFLVANTLIRPERAASEVDRYAAMPGQATGYMLGALEIRRLRAEAQRALGARFDLPGFHDAVLGAGTVPLGTLRENVERWMREVLARPAG
jgi:uncharacterized protein (DUF885 family)